MDLSYAIIYVDDVVETVDFSLTPSSWLPVRPDEDAHFASGKNRTMCAKPPHACA